MDNFIEFCFGEKERLVILLLHNGLFSFPILRKGDTGITSLLSSSTINACNNNSFSAIVFWLLSFDGIFRLFISAYSSGNFSTRVYSLRRKSRKFRICSLLNLLTGNPSMPLIMRNRVSSLTHYIVMFLFLPGPYLLPRI